MDEPTGWVAFFCTDPAATAADILGCVADRFALETAFRDCKDIVGAGRERNGSHPAQLIWFRRAVSATLAA